MQQSSRLSDIHFMEKKIGKSKILTFVGIHNTFRLSIGLRLPLNYSRSDMLGMLKNQYLSPLGNFHSHVFRQKNKLIKDNQTDSIKICSTTYLLLLSKVLIVSIEWFTLHNISTIFSIPGWQNNMFLFRWSCRQGGQLQIPGVFYHLKEMWRKKKHVWHFQNPNSIKYYQINQTNDAQNINQ